MPSRRSVRALVDGDRSARLGCDGLEGCSPDEVREALASTTAGTATGPRRDRPRLHGRRDRGGRTAHRRSRPGRRAHRVRHRSSRIAARALAVRGLPKRPRRCPRARERPGRRRRHGGPRAVVDRRRGGRSPTAQRSSRADGRRADDGSSRWAAPTSWSPTAASRAARCGAGLEVVAFADLDAPALAVAAGQGPALRVVPLDERRPAAAYARGSSDAARVRLRCRAAAGAPESDAVHTRQLLPRRPTTSWANAGRSGPLGRRARGWRGDPVAQSFAKARFLTVQEVADLMRVSSMTVYRLIKSGDLPAVRVGTFVPGERRRRRRVSRVALHPSRLTAARATWHGRAAGDARPPVVASFLSDYGHADEFVGVCKAVMLGSRPTSRSSTSPTTSRRTTCAAGALTLVRAVQYLPEGASCSRSSTPGVGTDRRLVAVEVRAGHAPRPRQRAARPGGGDARRRRAGRVDSRAPSYHLPAPGPTFAGRDVLAPAAGYLATGVPLAELGAGGRPGRPRPRARVAARVARAARSSARSGGSTASATASSTSTPTSSRRLGAGRRVAGSRCASATRSGSAPLGHDLRRRQAVGARAARRLLRPARARPRPRVGRGRVAAPGRARRSPWCRPALSRRARRTPCARERRSRSSSLLVLIFAAAFAQFVLRLGP